MNLKPGKCIYTIVILMVTIYSGNLCAQRYRLELSDNPLEIKYPGLIDSAQLNYLLPNIVNRYVAAGYASFNIDSIVWKKSDVKVFVYVGSRFKVGSINVVNDSDKIRFNHLSTKYLNRNYDTMISRTIGGEILDYMENNGFPFCRVNILTEPGEKHLGYDIQVNSGPYFKFDSSHIDGDPVIRKSFLEAYTGIREGSPYNEELYRKAHDKLNQLPFVISERYPQIAFIAGGIAKPYYYLRKRSSDQINGIVGLAPGSNSSTNPQGSNFALTGEFVLRLNNLFRSGKMLYVNWRSFKARSQELKTAFNFPYVIGLPLGLDASMEFTKFDTLYSTIQRQIGIQYYTSGINGFKVFYQVYSTNLNSVDTSLIRSSKQLPAINSVEVKQYGLSATFNFLDYRFNPIKGLTLEAAMSAGTKTILKDNMISEVRFGQEQYNLYDSTVLSSNQYQFRVKLDKFFPIGKKSTIRLGAYSSQLVAPKVYFNELLREGGINSLRGFNEQSIFASNFNMLELEFRFLLSTNSHIKMFWNGAYYEDRSYGRSDIVYDTPWGFGIGGNIETGRGILSLIYALGKEKGNPFDIRTGKVHIGLSSYF